jgi:hypothetical protein
MRFVVLIAIFGLWGCSKEAPTCPSSVRNAFEAVLEGKPANPVDLFAGNQEELRACFSSISNDPRAWNYTYGDKGQSKMKEFQQLKSEQREMIAGLLYGEFFKKWESNLKATVPK